MLETIKEDRKNELFDFLNYLLSTELYPYAFQANGHYQAVNLHKEIEIVLDNLFIEEEKGEKNSNELANAASRTICQLIDDDLFNYLANATEGNFYLINFNVFENKLSAKIKNLLRE